LKHLKKAALALVLVWSRLDCGAGTLQWDQTKIDLVAQPEQTELTADFGFRNAGTRPVTITGIDSSCPCTTATAAPKTTYGPGEAGRVHAVFEVWKQTGLVRKMLTVTSDDGGPAPTQLILEVKILQYAFVEPRMIYWKMGGDSSEQRILCSAQTDHRITLTGVTCSLPDIVATIDALEPGRHYAVRLRSPTHSEHATALIQLNVDIAGVGPRVIDAYAYYR
jgi:hypothetical protein